MAVIVYSLRQLPLALRQHKLSAKNKAVPLHSVSPKIIIDTGITCIFPVSIKEYFTKISAIGIKPKNSKFSVCAEAR